MIKVSIVIITYNRPINVLFRAINSVLKQDYENIEVFVVNDAPENTNLSKQIIDGIDELRDERIKYVSYEHNHGSNYARNYGLSHCTGDYVAFLDDDDEWYSNKITKQIDCFIKNPGFGLVYCDFDICQNNVIIDTRKSLSRYNDSIKNLLTFNYIGGSSFPLIKKSVLDSINGFDEEMKSCQEYELWIRLRNVSEFGYIEEALGIYHKSGDSTYRGNPTKYYLGDKRIIEKHESLFLKYNNEFNMHLNGMAMEWLRRGKIKWYFEYKRKAISVKPLSIYNLAVLMKLINKLKRSFS